MTAPKRHYPDRAIIQIKSVKVKKLEDNIGYIRIAAFQERTVDDYAKP